MHQFLKFIFGIKLYMFRTVPLSIVRSFSLYTQQWYMSNLTACEQDQDGTSLQAGSGQKTFPADPACKLCDIYYCCVYSEKLLMMNRGTV